MNDTLTAREKKLIRRVVKALRAEFDVELREAVRQERDTIVHGLHTLGKMNGSGKAVMELVAGSDRMTKAINHAPKGGADIAGKHYPGGQFIPDAELAKATPEERKKLEAKQKEQSGQYGAWGAAAAEKEEGAKTPTEAPATPHTVDSAEALARKLTGASGPDRAETVRQLSEAIGTLSRKEQDELKGRLGIKASGNRAEMARKIAERHASTDKTNRQQYVHEKVSVEDAEKRVKDALSDGSLKTPEGRRAVAKLLGEGLTGEELTELKRKLGVKASGSKAEVARKIAERAKEQGATIRPEKNTDKPAEFTVPAEIGGRKVVSRFNEDGSERIENQGKTRVITRNENGALITEAIDIATNKQLGATYFRGNRDAVRTHEGTGLNIDMTGVPAEQVAEFDRRHREARNHLEAHRVMKEAVAERGRLAEIRLAELERGHEADKKAAKERIEASTGHQRIHPEQAIALLRSAGFEPYKAARPKSGVPGRSGIDVNAVRGKKTWLSVEYKTAGDDNEDYDAKAAEMEKHLTDAGFTVQRSQGDPNILMVRKPSTPAPHPDDAELYTLNRTPYKQLTKEQRARRDELSRAYSARQYPGSTPVLMGGGKGPGVSDSENESTSKPKASATDVERKDKIRDVFSNLLREQHHGRGSVPIHEIRQAVVDQFGGSKQFDEAMHDLRRSGELHLVPHDDPDSVDNDQSGGSIDSAVGKLYYAEPGDKWKDRAPKPLKDLPPPKEYEQGVSGLIDDLNSKSKTGMVPIHELREKVRAKFGDSAASHQAFDEHLHDLRRSGRARLIPLDYPGNATADQLKGSIHSAVGNLFYLEKTGKSAGDRVEAGGTAVRPTGPLSVPDLVAKIREIDERNAGRTMSTRDRLDRAALESGVIQSGVGSLGQVYTPGGRSKVANMTDPERRAVLSYKNAGHVGVNRSLRTGTIDPRDQATIGHLDSAMSRTPLAAPTTVHRGLGNRMLLEDNGFPTDPKPGDTFTDPGYASTTTNAAKAAKWSPGANDVTAEIRVPAGVGAIHTDTLQPDQKSEDEVLLQRGLKYKVVKREPKPNGRGYHLILEASA